MSIFKKLAEIEWGFQKIVHDCLVSKVISLDDAKNQMDSLYKEEKSKNTELRKDIETIFQDYMNTIQRKQYECL